MRSVVPELREVVVLRAEHLLERRLDVAEPREVPGGHELPEEVRQLLRPVRMPERRTEQAVDRLVVDALLRLLETPAQEAGELGRRDRPDLEALRAPPERLVLVVEDPLEEVALAPEVDVADLRLLLEDRAHQLRVVAVDREDLLELVEDEHGAAPALGRDPARESEERLDRVVDGRAPPARMEDEAQAAVDRIDLDRRRHAQPAKEARRPLDRLAGRGFEVAVDRPGERGGEAFLRRRAHQVAVADENALADRAPAGSQNERRLPVAPRRVDENVLAVLHVAHELPELRLPVGEGVVERERAERERVGMRHCLTHYCIRLVCSTA